MKYPGLARLLGGVCVLGTLMAQPVFGQMADERWRATPVFGITTYDNATPLKTAPFVGAEAQYLITPAIRFGVGMSVARPIVDGGYYPLIILRVSEDTTMLMQLGQQVTQLNYMGLISANMPIGASMNVYGQGGLGGYTFAMDRQVMSSIRKRGAAIRTSGLLVPLGLGVSFGRAAAIRLEARDDIFFGFDREMFNPVEPRFQNLCTAGVHNQQFCLEDANATPPAAKETNHNIKLILGFELVPGRR
jgi:hypothetical protein